MLSSKGLVFIRPFLAGFDLPLTLLQMKRGLFSVSRPGKLREAGSQAIGSLTMDMRFFSVLTDFHVMIPEPARRRSNFLLGLPAVRAVARCACL